MRNNDEIIALVKRLMTQNNLSTSELARRLNIAKSSVSRYLNKTSQFPLNKANEFARVLNVTPEYLLGVGENKENDAKETIAAHLDGDLSQDDLEQVVNLIEYLKKKNKGWLLVYDDVNLMNEYERLMSENQHIDIYDTYKLQGNFKGVYSDGIIAIDKEVSVINKLELLAEELSHQKLTYGNILDQTQFNNRKFERYAVRDSYECALPLRKFVEAYKHNVSSLFELADYAQLSERYVLDVIEHYKLKYGLSTFCGDYLIRFEPLGVFEYKKLNIGMDVEWKRYYF